MPSKSSWSPEIRVLRKSRGKCACRGRNPLHVGSIREREAGGRCDSAISNNSAISAGSTLHYYQSPMCFFSSGEILETHSYVISNYSSAAWADSVLRESALAPPAVERVDPPTARVGRIRAPRADSPAAASAARERRAGGRNARRHGTSWGGRQAAALKRGLKVPETDLKPTPTCIRVASFECC